MDNIINHFNNYNFKDTFDIYKLYDELMLLSTQELLELFDIDDLDNDIHELVKFYFQDILKNMANNPRSKSHKRITKYKSDFNYLPDIYEHNFQEKLSLHRELWLNRYTKNNNTNKCDIDFFKLLNHQIYLKNILSPHSPYNGILLFHGVGVGKTCSAITIAETDNNAYLA